MNDGGLGEQASAVQKALVDVRTVCEELLSKNVDTIKRTLNEVRQQNDELKQQNDALKCQIDGTFQGRLYNDSRMTRC